MTTPKKEKVLPRSVPSRDEFYMGLAFWIASRSKDPNTQCGAIVVSKDNEPLGMGYNGPPKNIKDSDINWDRKEKIHFIDHAEKNAIKYSRGSTKDSTLYVTAHPCSLCMKDIVGAQIARVVWFPIKLDPNSSLSDPKIFNKAQEIAELGGVVIDKYEEKLNWMLDRIEWMKGLEVIQTDMSKLAFNPPHTTEYTYTFPQKYITAGEQLMKRMKEDQKIADTKKMTGEKRKTRLLKRITQFIFRGKFTK